MKLLILAATLLLPATTPGAPTATSARAEPVAQNVLREPAGCLPIVQQVAGEKREHRGTRLDQQPPAQLLLAVDRQVGGCREVTLIRRDSAPGAGTFGQPPR